jgi:hypothetical protein
MPKYTPRREQEWDHHRESIPAPLSATDILFFDLFRDARALGDRSRRAAASKADPALH